MKYIVIIILFLLFTKSGQGQSKLIDSIKINIENKIQNKDYTGAIIETLAYKTETEKLYSKVSSNYLYVLDCLYVLYDQIKQYKEAEGCLIESEFILRENAGIINDKYAKVINQLGGLYKDIGNIKLAEKNYILADSIYLQIQNESEESISNLDDWGWMYYNSEEYLKSIKIYDRILKHYENGINHKDEDYRRILVVLGKNYLALGNLKNAMIYFENCYSLLINSSNITNTELSNISGLIGLTYSKSDDFNNSEKYYKISIESKKNDIPTDTLGLAISMNNLGLLYKEMGRNEKAMEYFLESIELKKNINSINNLDYAYTLSNLGSLYLDLENTKSALKYQLEASNIIKNIYGENSVKYAGILNNLGHCYGDDYDKAKNIYLKVAEIQLNLLGANNPDYSVTLNNLGNVYSSLKIYDISEKYFKESIKIQQTVYGELHHLYITTLQNLGWVYYKTAKIDSCEKYLLKALELKIKLYGEKDAALLSTKELLTQLYLKKCDTLLAKKYIDEAVASSYNIIKNNFFFLTDKEKVIFLNKYENLYNLYNTIYFESKNEDYSKLFDLSIFNKGLVLKNSNLIEQKARISKDTIYFSLTNSLKELKTKLSKLYTDKNLQSTLSIENTKDKIYKTERLLAEHAAIYLKNNDILKYNWQDIKNNLKKGETAIEIISFNSNKDSNNTNDSTYYIALILKENYKAPELVYLFDEKQIKFLSKDNSPEILNNIYNNVDLYKLFWGKLSKYLNDGETVFISPSGLLNNYNFKTQILSNGQLVGEKFKIHILHSIEEIISFDEVRNIKDIVRSLYVFGGVDFGNSKIKASENTILSRSGSVYKWPFLSQSLIEASRIDSLMKNNNINSFFYYGLNAEEEKFKAIINSKLSNIIHVATHGYFIKNESVNTDQISNNANTSYNSGLIFSRANEYPSNFSDNQLISNDGNLTSLEISNLNLEFCKLVVLSACETGLGEIEGNEGIFGLQRAFKIAGVKNIITSLWKVPDHQTSELMTLFYKNLLNGESISDALLKSQLNMSKKYPPYYWASFILLE